jgi:glycosyltransferase involved in cell wall biosynthesis
MRIAFLDIGKLDYTAATPAERPLGGMQSAACYLAIALAARGHEVALVNRTTTPARHRGVETIAIETANAARLNGFDVIITIAAASSTWRQIGVTKPFLLWTGHDVDQPDVQFLREAGERFLFEKIIMVSNWQAERYAMRFKIKHQQMAILRNAFAPAFETLHRNRPYFFETDRAPILFYSSTPFRGLDVLLKAFPAIRERIPGCEAWICSGMSIYQTPAADHPYRHLYDLCRTTEGIRYIGPVGQSALAEIVNQIDIFAYPSTFPETSCIALMEAMAGGCMILTTKLGALPETAAGFGEHCELTAGPEELPVHFARFAIKAIQDARQNAARSATRIADQKEFARGSYCWTTRAAEWERLLTAIAQRPARMTVPRRNELCPCRSGLRFKHCCGVSV